MKRFLLSLVSILCFTFLASSATGTIYNAWVEHKDGYFNDKVIFHSNFTVYGSALKRCCLEIRITDRNGNERFVKYSYFTPNKYTYDEKDFEISFDYGSLRFEKEYGLYYLNVRLIEGYEELDKKEDITFRVDYDENAELGHRFKVSPNVINVNLSNIEVDEDYDEEVGYRISYEGESYSPKGKILKVLGIVVDAKARDRGEDNTLVGVVEADKFIRRGINTEVKGEIFIPLNAIYLDYTKANDIGIVVGFYDSDEKSENDILVDLLILDDISIPQLIESQKKRARREQTKKPATSTNVPTKSRRKGH